MADPDRDRLLRALRAFRVSQFLRLALEHPSSATVEPAKLANRLGEEFVRAAVDDDLADDLVRLAPTLALGVVRDDDGHLLRATVVSSDSGEAADRAAVERARAHVLESINRRDAIPMPRLLADVAHATVALLTTLEPRIGEFPRLKHIECVPNLMSGEAFIVPYECAFCANPASNILSFPNPLRMTAAHEATARTRMPPTDEFWVQFVLDAAPVPCHEVIHFVQFYLGQEDRTRGGWSSEHDASHASLSLFYALCRGLPAPHSRTSSESGHAGEGGAGGGGAGGVDVAAGSRDDRAGDRASLLPWPRGVGESMIMDALESARWVWSGWSPEIRAEFSRWRNAFGVYVPNQECFEDVERVTRGFKDVLSADGFFPDVEGLRAQIRLITHPDRSHCRVDLKKVDLPEPLRPADPDGVRFLSAFFRTPEDSDALRRSD